MAELGQLRTPAEVIAEVDRRLRTESWRTQGVTPAVYAFLVGEKDGPLQHFEVSLGRGTGFARAHVPALADCTITLNPDTLMGIVQGTLKPLVAFAFGRVKVQGNAGLVPQLGRAIS